MIHVELGFTLAMHFQDFGDGDHDQLLTSSGSERQPGGATRSWTTDSPASQQGKRMKSLEDLSGQ